MLGTRRSAVVIEHDIVEGGLWRGVVHGAFDGRGTDVLFRGPWLQRHGLVPINISRPPRPAPRAVGRARVDILAPGRTSGISSCLA